MENYNTFIELKNGLKMPKLGLGTARATSENDAEPFFKAIVEFGYRHIDTAARYDNEEIIGTVLQKAFKRGIVEGKQEVLRHIVVARVRETMPIQLDHSPYP